MLAEARLQARGAGLAVAKTHWQIGVENLAFARMRGALEEAGCVELRIVHDVVPARRLGMKTALFAGDKQSLQATPEQLKEPASRPDVLLTELSQIADVIG